MEMSVFEIEGFGVCTVLGVHALQTPQRTYSSLLALARVMGLREIEGIENNAQLCTLVSSCLRNFESLNPYMVIDDITFWIGCRMPHIPSCISVHNPLVTARSILEFRISERLTTSHDRLVSFLYISEHEPVKDLSVTTFCLFAGSVD